MQRTLNRTLSLLLAVVMVLSMIPVIASAAGETPVAEAVAVNTVTGEQYTDVSDALKSATEGQTIKLISDAQDTSVTVRPNTKLDLNGNKLECKYYFCYGATVDNSAANTGLLVPSRVVFSGTNEQIAIHNGTGYQFFQVQGFNTKEIEGGKFVFQPLFEEGALELLANGMDASGVKIEVHVGYRMGGFDKTAIFYFSDALVNAYLESYADGKFGQMFTLSISNAAEFGKLTFTPAVSSTAGITITPAQISVDENGQLTEDVTLQNGQNSAVVGAGTLLEGGNLTLTTTTLTESQAEVELGAEETLTSLDVHVEGLAKDNTVPVLVTLTQIAPESLNKGNIHLYHVEDGKTVEMTRVYSLAELDAHNEFYYDIPTGTVTVALCSFSEIAVRSSHPAWEGGVDHTWYDADAEKLYIYNADQLNSFAQIVGGMAEGYDRDTFSGQTVVLYSDIDLNDLTDENDYVFYPVGYYNSTRKFEKVSGGNVTSSVYTFAGIFDGNGHTIKNFYQNTWEMFGDYNSGYSGTPNHYKDAMGLFGYVNGGTVKNLTVEKFSSDGEFTPTGVIAAYACNATFENIAITNCNPRVYNTGNGGIVGIGGNDDDPDTYKLTFTNITIDNSNIISALWGSWDVACGGLVGMFRGAGHAYMTNCHVAAQIDVYNDVCGNYQYYWYRYAGMMIGTNKNMVTNANGYTVPETSKYHAQNCTVHFGTWNDYYYCEFVSNSQASYTHDYQMSRVPHSELNFTDTNGNGIIDTDAERASVNGCKHNHEAAGKEIVDGVEVWVEDKQAIYLPFNQLFTGYGWGVKHVPVYNGENYAFDGITILDREIADSVEKFEAVENVNTTYTAGTILTVDQLFKAKEGNNVKIDTDAVQVFVSPADKNSSVIGTYEGNTLDWTKGVLVLTGEGAATISITDYNYCKVATLDVTVTATGDTAKAYVKVTEAPADWSGEYLIVYETDSAKYIFNGENAVNGYITGTVQDDTIVSNDATNAVAVTIAPMTNGYSIHTSKGYIYGQSNSNELLFNATTAQLNTIDLESNGTVKITSNTSVLRFNATANQMRFRYYKSSSYTGQKAIALYKLDDVASKGCAHIDATIEITSATCEDDGKATIVCDCGTTEGAITKLGHQWGEWEETKAPTCTENGSRTATCERCEEKMYEQPEALGHDCSITVETVDATCGVNGYTTYKCTRCDETEDKDIVPATGEHEYSNGVCIVCEQAEPSEDGEKILATFEFGENGDAIHSDGDTTAISEYSETANGYKLTLDELNKVYKSARDAKGNSCIKLGAGSAAGSFKFTVPENVTSVVIKIAKYKTNTSKVTINGTTTTLTKNSNDGAYDEITVDTTSTKTVTLTTVSGGYRAMINAIMFYGTESTGGETACEHTNTTTTSTATCTAAGIETVTCEDCGKEISTKDVDALGHTTDSGVCDNCGETIGNTSTEPTVVLEITKTDFNTTSYAANNNNKEEYNDKTGITYKYTSNQIMQQAGTMQWQKNKGYITITETDFEKYGFTKLELKKTAGTFTVTVGGKAITASGTTSDGASIYDLSNVTGDLKISVGSDTGKVEYLKFYK